MKTKNSIYMKGAITIILVFTMGTLVACGDKEKPTSDRKQEVKPSNERNIEVKKTGENIAMAAQDTESPPTRETAKRTRESAQPGTTTPADERPPENTTKSPVSAAQTPFPEGKKVPHSECTEYYKSGTAHFRAREWDKTVEAFAKYPEGKCLGRVTKATDVWLANRAFMATCHTENNRYQEAFRKVHEATCKSWGDRAPCTKPLKCPKKQTRGQNCTALYNNGTQAFKEQKYQECLDLFNEYRTKGCFGRLTKSTDLWVAYRAIVSANKLGKESNAFMSKLKATCRVKSGWPCKKLLKNKQ